MNPGILSAENARCVEDYELGSKKVVFRCRDCGEDQPKGFFPRCRSCRGLVDPMYDLSSVKIYDRPRTSERYFDLLPIEQPSNLVDLGEGQTPCLPAPKLAARYGIGSLFLKQESINPTKTTKDRMAAIVLSLLQELQMTEFVSCSTGNSSSSLAYGVGKVGGFTMRLFVGEEFEHRVRFAQDNPGVIVHVLKDTPFTEAFNHAREEAQRLGLPFEAGFFNPGRREGLKLAYLEAVDQVPAPITHYFQAVSSAMGAYGAWKGATELHAIGRIEAVPRMVCVQQESCNPMVRAFRDNSREILEQHVIHRPSGIAKAILRGNPSGCYPYVYDFVKSSNGSIEDVTEAEILATQAELASVEGIDCGYCSAACLGGALKMASRGDLDRNSTVLINMTD